MTLSVLILLCCTVGVLFGVGVFLLLSPSSWRRVLGLGLLGNGVNVYLVLTGFRPWNGENASSATSWSRPSFVLPDDAVARGSVSDPLSQALVLTAIVIGFAVLALALVMWFLEHLEIAERTAKDSESSLAKGQL